VCGFTGVDLPAGIILLMNGWAMKPWLCFWVAACAAVFEGFQVLVL